MKKAPELCALGRYAVDPDMAPGGGKASGVAGHVVAVNEAEIELGWQSGILALSRIG